MFGVGLGGAAVSAWAKDFWNDRKPSEWTPEQIQQLLTKSPWAKDASIFDRSAIKGVPSGGRSAQSSRRGARTTTGRGGAAPSGGVSKGWKGTVRWDSALPIQDALKAPKSPDADKNYVIALVGDVPAAGIPNDGDDAAERQQKMDILQAATRIERRGEPIELQQVKLVPAGTLFYFSRVLPLSLDDKQVTFVTKLGPLEVKCKFILRDMLYRGALEL